MTSMSDQLHPTGLSAFGAFVKNHPKKMIGGTYLALCVCTIAAVTCPGVLQTAALVGLVASAVWAGSVALSLVADYRFVEKDRTFTQGRLNETLTELGFRIQKLPIIFSSESKTFLSYGVNAHGEDTQHYIDIVSEWKNDQEALKREHKAKEAPSHASCGANRKSKIDPELLDKQIDQFNRQWESLQEGKNLSEDKTVELSRVNPQCCDWMRREVNRLHKLQARREAYQAHLEEIGG